MSTSGLDQLSREHGEAGRRIRAMLAAAGRLRREPDAGALTATGEALAYFERDFVEHMAREDRGMLPTLDAVFGEWCALPAWMRREHVEIRAKLRDVRKAFDRAGGVEADRLEPLVSEVERLAALLTIHFHREDAWLYPIARQVLSAEQWAVIEKAAA